MPKAKAEALKEEGNALFVKKEFALAAKKYSEAIVQDGQNAVLYANRAACSLSLNKYLDASSDAKKATELDPSYSKAWARRATVELHLGNITRAVDAWQHAVDTLPKQDLNSAELKQKEQYEAGLKAALQSKADAEKGEHSAIRLSGKVPWEVAEEMLPALRQAENPRSSAWVIHGAYEEFSEGVRLMMMHKTKQTDQGLRREGSTKALSGITNGIMRDCRAFHIKDSDWIDRYNTQVAFESQQWRAWSDGGPDVILNDAQKRLRKEGWGAVRPALSTTVRALIMRGFFEGRLRENHGAHLTFLTATLDILLRGKKLWKNVPEDDRGVIFKDTFIRGVRSMRLNAWMQAYASEPDPNSKFPIEGLLEAADELIEEIKAHPLGPGAPLDPGFILSFVVYPHADALAIKAYCYAQMANMDDDEESCAKSHFDAAQCYLESASKLPEDDENHAWYLNTTLKHYFRCGAPLKESLEIMARIRLAIPKMSTLWANSALAARGTHKEMEKVLELEKEALRGLKQGEYTLDDPVAFS